MDLGLKDKVALITGTASQIGIGKAIAMTLAKEGCDIISADMNLEGAKQTAADVQALGHKAIAGKVDITKVADVGNMVKTALAEFGKIDILVNCAGGLFTKGFLHETKEEDWEKDINLNLYGTMNCIKAVTPGMMERKYGKIVNISSVSARIGEPAWGLPHAAAKAGIISVTMTSAKYLGAYGINVNGVAPGGITTNFNSGMSSGSPELEERVRQLRKSTMERTPIGRRTTTQDIANTVAFLVSDVSSDIVGQTISVDGGFFMI